MDEFKTEEPGELAEVSVAPPRWTGAPSIGLAHQLNEQCVELLCDLAANLSHQALPPFILRNRDLWRLLDVEARRRVAAFPFVIVDLRFQDADWWREVIGSQPMTSDATPFNDLAVETLLFARQSAREDLVVAKTMFAMTSPVASLVASLTLQQVRTIAAGHARELRVRWERDAEFWRDLLIACRGGDEGAMAAARRQGKLLFCGEVVQKPTQQSL